MLLLKNGILHDLDEMKIQARALVLSPVNNQIFFLEQQQAHCSI
jgi:hypothetical protein